MCLCLQVGCEIEFYLLQKVPDKAKGEALQPLDESNYCQSSAVDAAADGAASDTTPPALSSAACT